MASRDGKAIKLDFPMTPVVACEAPQGLVDALQIEPSFAGKTKFDIFLAVESEDVVRSLRPDFRLLARIPTRGIVVTSLSDDEQFDFISRFFAPAVGIDEDPVTGSAHCGLAPYWAERLGKSTMTAYQASPRGGIVRVTVEDERVFLEGQAVTVFRGVWA